MFMVTLRSLCEWLQERLQEEEWEEEEGCRALELREEGALELVRASWLLVECEPELGREATVCERWTGTSALEAEGFNSSYADVLELLRVEDVFERVRPTGGAAVEEALRTVEPAELLWAEDAFEQLRELVAFERWRLPDASLRVKGFWLRGTSPEATNLGKGFWLDAAAVVFARRIVEDPLGTDAGTAS